MNAVAGPTDNPVCEPHSSSCASRARCIKVRWLIAGAVFGVLFPVVGWLIAAASAADNSIAGFHRDQPVLYIVDLAPLILGIAGYGLGVFHARLIRIRHSIEEKVHERTAELETALENVAAAQEDRNRFVASVSHELRTPLTSVVGLAHTLAEPESPFTRAEEHEFLDLIVRESEEVASIVEDLLVVARSESGELALKPEPVCLSNELCAVAEVVRVEAKIADLDPVVVEADPVRIRQIIRNLLTNAHRYGGPVVSATVRHSDGWAILSVGDNGQGVPADKLDVIFSAFGRAHQRNGHTDSVGLGLTVSRQLARMMGGDVTYNRKTDWTSFELRIPVTTRVPSEPCVSTRCEPSDAEKELVSHEA